MKLRSFVLLSIVPVAAVLPACSGTKPGSRPSLLVVVNAPFSKAPYIGATIAQGAELAAAQINARGGVKTGAAAYDLRIERLDNALSPQQAVDNVRRAVAEHALAVVDEGTGIDASWPIAEEAHIPICIVYQGGLGLVDVTMRPNVFRIAPTDNGMAFRFAEYLIPKGVKIGFLHDDSGYGQQGNAAFDTAFRRNLSSVAADAAVAAGAEPAPQVLQARRSGATALLVWGLSSTVAQVVRAARSAGWNVPVYAPPSGEDPLVRQQLSDHPDWVNGLTFASGRMTAEVGPGPFLAFQRAYETKFGADDVGVKTAEGKEVIQPPDYAQYPYDFVNLLAAAVAGNHGRAGAGVISALNQVDVRGANGDERSFNEVNHDGVVDDDVYFAAFRDMTFAPVKDDPLSATLPVIPQTR
jgi:ABC-type branched-subunit amino acid transport system substrate-binding protein